AQRGFAGALARPTRRQTMAEKPRRARVYRWRANLPSVGRNPLYWKERYLGRTIAGTIVHNVATACLAAVAVALTVVFEFHELGGLIFAWVAVYLRGLAVLTGFFLMVGLGVRLIGTISREREQRTLESLLTIPGRRRTILSAKWVGAWLRTGRYSIGLAVALVLCAVVKAASVPLCLLTLLVILVHSLFAASLSLYLSTLCRSTARAYFGLALVITLLFAGTWAVTVLVWGGTPLSAFSPTSTMTARTVSTLNQAGPGAEDETALTVRALNPLLTWWRFLDYHPLPNRLWRDAEMHAQLFATAVYAAAAGILWTMAHNRFRREAVLG
ncbi:MAG: ABC transporter permease, partial [Gemmataceae bacterium]